MLSLVTTEVAIRFDGMVLLVPLSALAGAAMPSDLPWRRSTAISAAASASGWYGL